MKFGKRLEEQLREHPDWVYINYKALKTQLKRVQQYGRNLQTISNGVYRERDLFLDLVFRDIDAINSFYITLENRYSDKFSSLLSQIQQLIASSSGITMETLAVQHFIQFCEELDELRKYVVWNYVGVLKILKKFAKKTAFDVREMILGTLTSKEFYKTSVPATLYTEAQILAAQILYCITGVPPKKEDFTCPICLEVLQNPVVLSCAHRFCWVCIGQASQHQMSACPVCRKEQPLNPTSYHVDSALDKFVNSNFKSKHPNQDVAKANLENTHLLMDLTEKIRQEELRTHKPEYRESKPSTEKNVTPSLLPSSDSNPSIISCDRSLGVVVITQYWAIIILAISLIFFGITIRTAYDTINGDDSFKEKYHNLLVRFETHFAGDDNTLHPILPFMPDTVFVGHLNNDVDSVCSSIAASYLFKGQPASSGQVNKETEFVLKKFDLTAPPLSTEPKFQESSWCLVDHNSHDKIPLGVNREHIVCVIDHHQIQEDVIATKEPRMFEVEPFGSTTTMLFWRFMRYKVPIPKPIAGCLISGVISDTLNLTSPTTTENDRRAASHLQKLAGIPDITQYALEMFEAKSNIDDIPASSVVTVDFKTFTIERKRLGIAVTETVRPQAVWKRKYELKDAALQLKMDHHLDFMLYMVIDILELNTEVLALGEDEYDLIRGAYKGKLLLDDHMDILNIGRLVSRKKQFVPLVHDYLARRT